ncbi:MAG: VRR-NUC domain-containing protein, partial [Geobacteraceae bacterium]|nr:VRR-NUC domain-containing protein [Geobacteraceae bacterium]
TKKLVKKASECSLSKQCQLLNLPLEVIQSSKSGKPEHIVLENYVSSGYIGAYCEGGAILTALKALCLDLLAELNTSKLLKTQRQDACSRYFEAQCLVLNDKTEILLDAMESTSKSRFIQNFIEIYSYDFVRNIYPGLSVEFMTRLYDGVGINILCDIARVFMEDPYSYRAGWPDLTLIKGNEIRFIEVKTSDKLLESQVKTIQTMRQVLPDAFYVAKVVKNK